MRLQTVVGAIHPKAMPVIVTKRELDDQETRSGNREIAEMDEVPVCRASLFALGCRSIFSFE